jgi:hypothetical protein
MFNINQNFSDAGASSSAGIQDEQDVAPLPDNSPLVISELPGPVATPIERDSATAGDNTLNHPQTIQGTNAMVQSSAVTARDRLPSLIAPTQSSVPQPMTIDPSPPMVPAPQTERMATDGLSPTANADLPRLFTLPENAKEAIWMKKKCTLNYFRSTFKMGGLSGLISNWYELERALGFPEQVCLSHADC